MDIERLKDIAKKRKGPPIFPEEGLTFDDVHDALGDEEFTQLMDRVRRHKTERETEELARKFAQLASDLVRAAEPAERWTLTQALEKIFRRVDADDSGTIHVHPEMLALVHGSPGRAAAARPRLQRTQERDFEGPILSILETSGGAEHASRVKEILWSKMGSHLTPDDLASVASTGEPRWWVTAKYAKKHLVQRGLISSSPARGKGWWELTPQGRQYLRTGAGSNEPEEEAGE